MKKILLAVMAFALAFTFTACEDGEQRFEIPVTLSGFNATLDGSNQYKVFSTEVVTNGIEAQLNDYGYSLDNVKKIEAKNTTLRITTNGVTFDNIEYMDAWVEADGIDAIKVAYDEGIPAGATAVALASQFSDITSVLKKPTFTFYVRAYNEQDFGPAAGEISFTIDVIAEK